MYKTDLDAVKHVAVSLLYTHINESKVSPMVVQHPFTSSGFVETVNCKPLIMLSVMKTKYSNFLKRTIVCEEYLHTLQSVVDLIEM